MDLRLLGVDYHYRVFDDIQFGIMDADMPPELLQSMCSLALDLLNHSHRTIYAEDRVC